MKRILVYLLVFFVSLVTFGQKNAQLFLPEVFNSYPNVRDITMAPNGSEIYFTVDDIKSRIALISFIKKTKNGWNQPKSVSFTGKYRDLEAAFSPDGKRLYFVSNRPIHKDSVKPKDYDIWYVNRTTTGWSEPTNIGDPINTLTNEFYPSVTGKGDIYFTSEREGTVGKEDIFVSRLKDGKYQEPISISGEINTEYFEFNSFVSPDESYLIFSGQRPKEGKGGGDLYISYYNNGWSKGKLLEMINSEYLDFCPFVDTKTGTFYFTSQKTDIQRQYKKALDLDTFLKMYKQSPKGLNRIYQIDFKELVKD